MKDDDRSLISEAYSQWMRIPHIQSGKPAFPQADKDKRKYLDSEV